MPEAERTRVITANAARSGQVVYLRADGEWTAEISEAAAFEQGKETEEAVAQAARQERTVCDPYAIEVVRDETGYRPMRLRERIRQCGPTTPVRRGGASFEPADKRS